MPYPTARSSPYSLNTGKPGSAPSTKPGVQLSTIISSPRASCSGWISCFPTRTDGFPGGSIYSNTRTAVPAPMRDAIRAIKRFQIWEESSQSMSRSDSYSEVRVPPYSDLLWPTLLVLKARGGSASIRELEENVASLLRLSDEVVEMPHGAGPQSEVNYRAAWARTHLRLIGAIDNTSRGVWAITEHGRSIDTEDKLRKLDKQPRVQRKSGRCPPRVRQPPAQMTTRRRPVHGRTICSVS